MSTQSQSDLVLIHVRALRRSRRGVQFAGVVESVGENVRGFNPGDAVYGMGSSEFAEHLCAPQDDIALKPDSLDFEQAAAVILAGLNALRDSGRPEAQGRRADLEVLAALIDSGSLILATNN